MGSHWGIKEKKRAFFGAPGGRNCRGKFANTTKSINFTENRRPTWVGPLRGESVSPNGSR